MRTITQTNRIIIREFLPAELEIYLKHFTDEAVILHLPKRSKEEHTVIFNIALSQYPTDKLTGKWGIFNKKDNQFIGSCLLRPFNDQPGVIELGYSLEQKYWGQGIGTEMAKAMVIYGFSDASVTEIVGLTTIDNIASQQVLEKAGLKHNGNLLRGSEELALFRLYR